MNNKRIAVIFTGGTISMEKHDQTSKAIIKENQSDLIQNIKDELRGIELIVNTYSLKPSPSFTPDDMFKLSKLTEKFMNDSDIDGIVITHGTDTLEETAYFLDCYLDIKKPVVFTGSMRNYSELGFDGLSNLVSSILVAAHDESKNFGVLLVMNDEINAVSEVTKTHTLSLDTFASMEFGPLGIVEQDNVLYYRDRHFKEMKIKPERIISDIEIIKAYTGASSDLLNFVISNGTKGIIIEALGRGNIPPTMLDGIQNAIKNNIPVLITSRCPKGRVLDSYGYEGGGHQLKLLGCIFTKNLNSQKARIRLMLVLGITSDMHEIAKYF